MPLRIGFDMDGVLADFSSAFREYETRLFGPAPAASGGRAGRERRESAGDPEKEEERQSGSRQAQADADARRDSRRREDAVWEAIEAHAQFLDDACGRSRRARSAGFTS